MSHLSITEQFTRRGVVVLVFLTIVFAGCSKPQVENHPRPVAGNSILDERRAKDEDFRSGADSPIREKDRPSFRGLAYYPPNPDLDFTVQLHRYPAPRQIMLATNTGEIRRGLRYGYFDFKVSGQDCRLQVYRLEDSSGSAASLFIPFRDATSGVETYASGRYIDLKENTTGIYELDFNRAYNPYCAYNSDFSCPVPPAENTLAAAVRAGEKKYPSGAKN